MPAINGKSETVPAIESKNAQSLNIGRHDDDDGGMEEKGELPKIAMKAKW